MPRNRRPIKVATGRDDRGTRLSIALLAMTVMATMAWGQNSLYQRANDEVLTRSLRGNAEHNYAMGRMVNAEARSKLGTSKGAFPVLRVSWLTVEEPAPKDFRVHDLVTIVVNEMSKHTTKADTSTERSYALDAKLEEWFRLTKGGVRLSDKEHGAPQLKLAFDREFEGAGDVEREDSLSARIQAEIIDILPNGTMILEASHTVVTDDEVTHITLSGICRSKDITSSNTILSSQIARLRLKKTHEGMARDATRPGLISGLIDWLNPL